MQDMKGEQSRLGSFRIAPGCAMGISPSSIFMLYMPFMVSFPE